MKKFIIEEDLANKILDYLDDKPAKEVFELLDGLMHLKEYKEPPVVPTIKTEPPKVSLHGD